MIINNGVLSGVKWLPANASGASMSPRWIVVHDTAGRLDKGSSVNWFCDRSCKVSAHFVVERDGTITQMVRTDRRAYHAGVSKWAGVSGLNSCSVGIEIVNPGKMDETGKAWFGKAANEADLKRKKTSSHGDGYWLDYTPEQIEAVIKICRAVVEEYPDCNDIITHWMISPGRKIDTNPLFPLEEVKARVFDPTPGEIEIIEETVPVAAKAKPAVPSRAKSASESWTVRSLLLAVISWMASVFDGIRDWIVDVAGSVVGIIGGVVPKVAKDIEPIKSLGDLVGANIKTILPVVAIALTTVAIARHVRDRNRVKELEAHLGDGDVK